MEKKFKIVYLLSDLLDFDGTRGDMIYFISKLKEYDIAYEYVLHKVGEKIDLADADFVYAGVCPQKYEDLFLRLLHEDVTGLHEYIESGKSMLAVEQSFLFLSKGLVKKGETHVQPLLGILPFNVFQEDTYTVGNILLETSDVAYDNINGFINSRYVFELPNEPEYLPLGTILLGKDYLWERGYEGLRYKGFIGTQLRGPILPRNYDLCDALITQMISDTLPEIDQTLELAAKEQLTKDCKRFIDSEEQKKEYVYVS